MTPKSSKQLAYQQLWINECNKQTHWFLGFLQSESCLCLWGPLPFRGAVGYFPLPCRKRYATDICIGCVFVWLTGWQRRVRASFIHTPSVFTISFALLFAFPLDAIINACRVASKANHSCSSSTHLDILRNYGDYNSHSPSASQSRQSDMHLS